MLTVMTVWPMMEMTMRENLNMPDPWLDLIYEGHGVQYLPRQENSAWKTYFKVLPHTFDTLMFWSQSELNELQASAVKDKVGKVC